MSNYLVLKSYMRSRIPGVEELVYHIVRGSRRGGMFKITSHREVTMQQAADYIRAEGFKVIYSDEDGKVYGDPDDSFRKTLCPNGLTKEERYAIGEW